MVENFLYLLKCRDYTLLQATSEDYLQLPVIAAIVSNASSISGFPYAGLCCCLNRIWSESLKKVKPMFIGRPYLVAQQFSHPDFIWYSEYFSVVPRTKVINFLYITKALRGAEARQS